VLGALVTGAFIQAMANSPQTPTLDGPQYLADFVLVKSEFVDDPRFGKDPFYPTSQRRFGPRYTPTQVIQPDAPVTELALKGISGSRNQPLAIINNRTFAVGETADMKINNQILKVRCIEINDKAVKITINGVPKELPRTQR
jgi:hypothetical protein